MHLHISLMFFPFFYQFNLSVLFPLMEHWSRFMKALYGVLWMSAIKWPHSGDRKCIKPPVEANFYFSFNEMFFEPFIDLFDPFFKNLNTSLFSTFGQWDGDIFLVFVYMTRFVCVRVWVSSLSHWLHLHVHSSVIMVYTATLVRLCLHNCKADNINNPVYMCHILSLII